MYSKEQINRGVKKIVSFECEQDYIDFCLDIISEITGDIKRGPINPQLN